MSAPKRVRLRRPLNQPCHADVLLQLANTLGTSDDV